MTDFNTAIWDAAQTLLTFAIFLTIVKVAITFTGLKEQFNGFRERVLRSMDRNDKDHVKIVETLDKINTATQSQELKLTDHDGRLERLERDCDA